MTENSDVVFVGNKPPMSYVLAIITSLSSGDLENNVEGLWPSNNYGS